MSLLPLAPHTRMQIGLFFFYRADRKRDAPGNFLRSRPFFSPPLRDVRLKKFKKSYRTTNLSLQK